jgi:hypothetical protein
MPDEELMRLAAEGQLRQNLPAQMERMLKDKRSKAFVRNFTGQWLRARDIDNVQIDEPGRAGARARHGSRNGASAPALSRFGGKRGSDLSKEEKKEMDEIRRHILPSVSAVRCARV